MDAVQVTDHSEMPRADTLEPWLTEHLTGFRGPMTAIRLQGGQSNPTFRLSTPSAHYVLRRKPFGELLPSAHAIEREFRVMRALRESSVPVPAVHLLCEDPSIVGTPFYVMDFVTGRMFADSRMPGISKAERIALFDAMNAAIAGLHSIDPAALGLDDFGRAGNYLERQIGRWTKQYRASAAVPIDEMERIIEWLSARLPDERGARIVHGDFKVDNILFHPCEARVLAVLDWELATIGDPLADFAYHLMAWHLEQALFRGWAGEDLPALGIPSEQSYADAYAARTGIDRGTDWRFYIVFSMFRLAAILQGIARRAEAGNASDQDAAGVGRQARPVALKAWQMANA
jgi:aminoglycoside phosphotransferase (APT) family kinase protein